MLPLHCRHGDLKAGNVLLTVNTSPSLQLDWGRGSSSQPSSGSSTQAWLEAGSQPLSAKVADFGLSLPLGPQDTHATMMARVSLFAGLHSTCTHVHHAVCASNSWFWSCRLQ